MTSIELARDRQRQRRTARQPRADAYERDREEREDADE